jgi:tetratricopeptide (TPR) repeat protein
MEPRQSYPVESTFWQRLWDAIKPPPGPGQTESGFTKQQKSIIRNIGLAMLALAAAGWAYSYYSSAPQRAEASFREGMKFLGPGNYSRAIEHFDRAISIWDTHALAYLKRGTARRMLGQTDQALSDFDQAVKLNPSLEEAHAARAAVLESRGQEALAAEALAKSIQIRPTVEALYQRGQQSAARSDYKNAIADFDQAIALDRAPPYLYRARAAARRAMGDQPGYNADRDLATRIETQGQ